MNIELQVKNLYANVDKLDEAGFVADFYYIAKEYARQQLLQQTTCTTQVGALQQMLKDVDSAIADEENGYTKMLLIGKQEGLRSAMQLVKERQSLA